MALLELQRRLPRGPKREGAFALWLTVRVALDIGLGDTPVEKGERRRVPLLQHRLAPMSLPPSLTRGLSTAMIHLNELTRLGAKIALAQLVAPAKDALGAEAAEAVAEAARMIHEKQREAMASRASSPFLP